MKILILILTITLTIAFTCFSCNLNDKKANNFSWSDSTKQNIKEQELMDMWDKFIVSVKNKDFLTLKKLSTSIVYCSECAQKPFSNENASTSIDEFIRQGEYKRFYWEGSYVKSIDESDSLSYFVNQIKEKLKESYSKQLDVLVGDNCKGEECSQTIISFVKTKEGYKFCGYFLQP